MGLCFVDYKERKRRGEREKEGRQVSGISLINEVFCLCYKCFDRVMLMLYCMVLKR